MTFVRSDTVNFLIDDDGTVITRNLPATSAHKPGERQPVLSHSSTVSCFFKSKCGLFTAFDSLTVMSAFRLLEKERILFSLFGSVYFFLKLTILTLKKPEMDNFIQRIFGFLYFFFE